MEPHAEAAEQYAEFADEAVDSPCFADWARAVAADPEVLAWVATLPGIKQQPNLVFAAARWHGVPAPAPYGVLREALLADDGAIRATVMERSTQTNEAGRLATLAPVFAELADGRPLALLEVGASAGLCLYPDRYAYRWTTDRGVVTARPAGDADAPELACEVHGPAPLPERSPEVAWRGGVDLNPLDVTDADAMAWLEMLVWPEHEDRRRRLQEAVRVARTDPPHLVRGDLVEALPVLVAEAAGRGPVVVFHSAVIAYLPPPARRDFERLMTGLVADGRCHWVSNEAPRVLPDVAATGPEPPAQSPLFVLGVDGRSVAWAHGHGRSLTWHDAG